MKTKKPTIAELTQAYPLSKADITARLPRPRAFGGGELDPSIEPKEVTPEAAERDFIKVGSTSMMKPFYDADDNAIFFDIRRDKDGSWYGFSDEYRIHCHGDTMRELWELIHSYVKSFSSRLVERG